MKFKFDYQAPAADELSLRPTAVLCTSEDPEDVLNREDYELGFKL